VEICTLICKTFFASIGRLVLYFLIMDNDAYGRHSCHRNGIVKRRMTWILSIQSGRSIQIQKLEDLRKIRLIYSRPVKLRQSCFRQRCFDLHFKLKAPTWGLGPAQAISNGSGPMQIWDNRWRLDLVINLI